MATPTVVSATFAASGRKLDIAWSENIAEGSLESYLISLSMPRPLPGGGLMQQTAIANEVASYEFVSGSDIIYSGEPLTALIPPSSVQSVSTSNGNAQVSAQAITNNSTVVGRTRGRKRNRSRNDEIAVRAGTKVNAFRAIGSDATADGNQIFVSTSATISTVSALAADFVVLDNSTPLTISFVQELGGEILIQTTTGPSLAGPVTVTYTRTTSSIVNATNQQLANFSLTVVVTA